MRVVDWLVDALVAQGVCRAYSVTGGASAWINDALQMHPKMEVTFCHHEAAAVMAAEGDARLRRSPGLAVVTIGPGSTNALTGVAGAWLDSVPLLVLAGQAFTSQTVRGTRLRQFGVQEVDIISSVRSMTKFAATVDSASRTAELFEVAFNESISGRRGPVWLELPGDVQSCELADDEFRRPRLLSRPRLIPPASEVASVAIKLMRAQRPLLHVGKGLADSKGGAKRFIEFVERHEIPFITAHNSNDLVETDHPLRVGFSGIFGNRSANFVVQQCDFFLALGTRLSLPQTGYNAADYAKNADMTVVDIDAAELLKPSLSRANLIHADASDFLEALEEQVPQTFVVPRNWRKSCTQVKIQFPHIEDAVRTPHKKAEINGYLFLAQLSQQGEGVHAYVTDMGLSYQATHQALALKMGQRLITNTGLASMGWGLPAAIGASQAAVDCGLGASDVVLLTGDGGLMMNLQELSTLAHARLPLKVFIFNNRGYLTIRQSQELGFESRYTGVDASSGLSFPDFVAVATAFGIVAFRLDDPENISVVIAEALAHPGPVIVDVAMPITQVQAPRMINERLVDGSIQQSSLDNMWPFLAGPSLIQQMVTGREGSGADEK